MLNFTAALKWHSQVHGSGSEGRRKGPREEQWHRTEWLSLGRKRGPWRGGLWGNCPLYEYSLSNGFLKLQFTCNFITRHCLLSLFKIQTHFTKMMLFSSDVWEKKGALLAIVSILPIQMYSMTLPPTDWKEKGKYHVSTWHQQISNFHIFWWSKHNTLWSEALQMKP